MPTPTGSMAYLTFDDQPNGYTPQVLEKLSFYGVKATFNILGVHLDSFNTYLDNIIRDAHAVGLHSMNHYIPWYADPAYGSAYDQLTELMRRVTSHGVQPQIWRAPVGAFEDELPAPYNKSLYRYGWDINPLDEVNNMGDPQTIYGNYQAEMQANADDSIIVLLHGWTPDVLDLIIPDLTGRGYQFGVLPRPGDPIGPVIWD